MDRSTPFGEFWAEVVGTAILIIFGDGVVANVVYAPRLPGGGYSWDTIVWGWGLAVAMAVYVAGGVTGAHINPAVTLAAVLRRGLSLRRAVLYWLGQFSGAFVGAAVVYGVYYGSFVLHGYKNVFYTGPGQGYGLTNAFFAEVVGTFFLLLFIHAIVDAADNLGPGANLWPFMVGLAVLVIGLSLGGPSGYAINPTRDLGPRVFAAVFLGDRGAFAGNYWWAAPIVGPLIGGSLGIFFYDFLVRPFLPQVMKMKHDQKMNEGA